MGEGVIFICQKIYLGDLCVLCGKKLKGEMQCAIVGS
jgi:hypothetical protein